MIYMIALTVLVGALSFYYFFLKDITFFKKRGIPYITPVPILGNMGPSIFRLESMAELVKKVYDIHPDAKYVGMYDLTTPITVIRDPDLIKSIALKHFDMFMDHRPLMKETQDLLFGNNLFSLRGERWRGIRSLLTPTFTSSKMKNMFKLIMDYSADFGNFLAQLPPEQRIIETKDTFARYTSDVIATCAFGVSFDSMRNPKNQFYLYGREAACFNISALLKIYIFKTMPWLAQLIRLRFVREEITYFFKDIIETTIKTRDENGIVRPDMLQLLMESRGEKDKTELTIDDMVSQAFAFFFGGSDTTSTLMCFTAHEITVNPDVQKRLQSEIDQVLEDTNGQAPYDAVMGMEYLDAVLNENLRMYPSGVVMDRVCTKDFELPPTLPGTEPFTIRKGQVIWIPFYGLHHDPIYFKDPEKFDPERFLGERKRDSLNCKAFLPFGLGPRKCIGYKFALMETKILFFHLLARCDLKICEKTPIPLKIAKDGFSMSAEGGFWLSVVPRKNPHHSVIANVVNGTSNP